MWNELLRGHALWAKLLRFGAVGALSSVFYGICTWLLVRGAALPPVAASVLGYLLAIPFSFFMQRRFAFRSGGRVRLQGPRFLAIHGLNLLASTAVMHVTTRILQLDYRLGIVATMLVIPLLSFVAMNAWVFRHARHPDRPS